MMYDVSLESILNTSSKAKIIRLFTSKKVGFKASGRHIAALINTSAPATHTALKVLYGQKILIREIIGRQHIYSLNNDSEIVKELLKPIFQKEDSLKKEINSHLIKQVRKKNIYIIAGSNGSGKTTFANRFLPEYAQCLHFVNSDLIAQGLSPFSPGVAAMKAGRLVLEQIDDLSRKGLDFGFETTLAGKSYLKRLDKLKKIGYSLHLFFLWIPSVELATERIKDRVAEGGHNVPAGDVKRRFFRGIYNLFQVYKPILDSWMLLNNSSITPSLIAKEKGKELIIVDKELFTSISRVKE